MPLCITSGLCLIISARILSHPALFTAFDTSISVNGICISVGAIWTILNPSPDIYIYAHDVVSIGLDRVGDNRGY